MPRKVLVEDEKRKGEGIYARQVEQQFRTATGQEIQDTIDTQAATEAQSANNYYHELQADCLRATGDISLSDSVYPRAHIHDDLRTTQQVLDVLDLQIDTLNELKLKQQKGNSNNHTCETASENNHFVLASVRLKDPFESFEVERSNAVDRKSILNHYIRHSIDETGECGCHFQIELDNNDDNDDLEVSRPPFSSQCQPSESRNSPLLPVNEYQSICNTNPGSIDNSNVDCDNSGVFLGLSGAATRESRVDGCRNKRRHAKLLIDCVVEQGDYLGSEARASTFDDIERDLAPHWEQQQPLKKQRRLEALAGVRAGKHRCACGICSAGSGDGLRPLLIDRSANSRKNNNNNNNNNYQYSSTSVNEDPAFKASSSPSGENCAISAGAGTNNLDQIISSYLSSQDEDCESELGYALEGLVDSLNSPSSSPSLFLNQLNQEYQKTEQKLKTGSSSLLGSSNSRNNHHNNSYHNIIPSNEQQDCGPSNLGASLSWSRDFPPSSINSNILESQNKDKQQDSYELNLRLRRQLYTELNEKFLLANKLKKLLEPEEEQEQEEEEEEDGFSGDLNNENNINNNNLEHGFKLALAKGPRLVSDAYHEESSLSTPDKRIEEAPTKHNTRSSFRESRAPSNSSGDNSHRGFKVVKGESSIVPLTSSYPSSSSSSSSSSSPRATANELDNSVCCCCLARNHQQQGDDQENREAQSIMRSVRDIAKISIPSLASLQYLPNQIDIEKNIRGGRRGSKRSRPTTRQQHQRLRLERNMDQSGGPIRRPPGDGSSGGKEMGESQKVRVISAAESGDNVQHESGLLHNLCLCNCMAKSQHDDEATSEKRESPRKSGRRKGRDSPNDDDDNKASGRKSADELEGSRKSLRDVGGGGGDSLHSSPSLSFREEGRRSGSSFRSLKSSSRASETTTSNPSEDDNEDEDVELSLKVDNKRQQVRDAEKKKQKRKRRDNKAQDSEEKQSPSFLNILRSSAHISHNFRQHLPSARQRVEIGRGPQSLLANASAAAATGNSVGDLEATESCCSSGRDSVDTNATSGFSFMRAHSASFSGLLGSEKQHQTNHHQRPSSSASCNNRPNDDETDLALSECTTNYSTRAQSACSSPSARESDRDEDPRRSKSGGGGFSERHKRRFQSFFTTSKPSRGGSLRGQADETQTGPQESLAAISDSKNKNKKNDTKSKSHTPATQNQSFFTRSLNRLSNRKQPSNLKPSNQNSTGLLVQSPTISISTVDSSTRYKREESILTDDSMIHATGGNSFEDLVELSSNNSSANLPTSHRPRSSSSSLRPAIVFDRVSSYTSGPNRSTSSISCDMTRNAKSGNRRQAGDARDRRPPPPQQLPYRMRYGSEISDCNASEAGGLGRACSLPASPHGQRRNDDDLAGGSHLVIGGRSPRLTRSPVPFPSPANESTKIEDGLKVCSTEHFEKHIGNIKGIQIEAQKRLFTIWINHYCPNLIRGDLVDELRDGIKLIGLIGSLTRDKKLLAIYDKLISDKQAYINRLVVTPGSRLKHLSNVSIAIDYLRQKLNLKMINLNPMDVVSGKPNVTLGLCWNIILNFQLEQNLGASEGSLRDHDDANDDGCSIISSTTGRCDSSASNCTSRLSYDDTKEEGAMRTRGQSTNNSRRHNARDMGDSPGLDLVGARKRLLNHINKRFNLKLTNLTSNLLDGDVLYVILKQLAPQIERESEIVNWRAMGNDEKLDHCFEMAQDHLKVPRLFSASDLKYQIETDNHSKPLLVYLSMLLKTPSSSFDGEDELNPPEIVSSSNQVNSSTIKLEESPQTRSLQNSSSASLSLEVRLRNCINEIDREDKFELDKIQSTLTKIKELKRILNNDAKRYERIDGHLLASGQRLVDEANRVESLIAWINRADNLFETRPKSPIELTNAIDQYRKFFSPENIPQVGSMSPLCPTLERQYRECLGSAKQRVLLMEQTLKNWDGYEKARRQLKEWLSTAELKLANALHLAASATVPTTTEVGHRPLDTIEHHTGLLEDLVAYFELEPIDSILANDDHSNGPNANFLNYRLPSLESLPSSLLGGLGNESLSGSVLSIGSTSSRYSTLQCSKKATCNKLFDDFELKCRLLASQLDPDQRDALLTGVRELKYRLRHITEQKVPQVVSELKFNISRCEMSIEECEEEEEEDEEDGDGEQEPTQDTTTSVLGSSVDSGDDDDDDGGDSSLSEDASQVMDSTDLVSNAESSAIDSTAFEQNENDVKVARSVADKSFCEDLQESPRADAAALTTTRQAIISTNKPEIIVTSKEAFRDQNKPLEKLIEISPEKPMACKTPSKNSKNTSGRQQNLNSKSKVSHARNNTKSPATGNETTAKGSARKVSSVAESKPDHHESWSLFKWFLADGKKDKGQAEVIGDVKRGGSKSKRKGRSNNKSKSTSSNNNNNNKQHGGNKIKSTNVAADGGKPKKFQDETTEKFPGDITFTRLFWSKLIRAYRASMPLNIILLICLAGICVVPLMNKDACCELTQGHIPTKEFSLNQRPT